MFSPGWCGSVVEHQTAKQKGCRFDSQSRAHDWVAGQSPVEGAQYCVPPTQGRQPHINVSLPLFFSLFLSLKNKINKILLS